MKFFDRFRKKKDEEQQPLPDSQPREESAAPAETDSDAGNRPAPTADELAAALAPAPTLAPTPIHAEPPAGGPIEQLVADPAVPAAPETEPATAEPAPAAAEIEAEAAPAPEPSTPDQPAPEQSAPEQPAPAQKAGWFSRLRAGLKRTSDSFAEGMGNLFLGEKEIDDDLLEELETQLLMADVGIDATQHVIGNLTRRVSRKELSDTGALYNALQQELEALLEPATEPLVIDTSRRPFVILVVGVNGVGKTTTIGKLARRYIGEGKSVMLAAGDTFRAAAVEQLQVWGERNSVPVVAQHTGADSASVIFDALQAAQARGTDVLIADTAGRLHNKEHLMEELKKVVRVMRKLDPSAPHEVMLVLDAGTGQNALAQARHFQEAVGVTGITLTKLDGTAKGGIIFGISRQSQLPIRFIGVGEQAEDLRPFVAQDFVKALFQRDAG